MITHLQTYLTQRLQQEMPGKKAHQEAAPYRKVELDKKELINAKKSGVLILFYTKENEIYLVLTQRATYHGKHSGQISFPGGKQEKTDQNIIHTALREANEEIGIVANAVTIVGKLSPIYIPVSNFHVVPVVGIVNCCPNFTIDHYEVTEIIPVKLADLMKVTVLETATIALANNTLLKVPAFNFNSKIIWGATAIILNELRWLLKAFNP